MAPLGKAVVFGVLSQREDVSFQHSNTMSVVPSVSPLRAASEESNSIAEISRSNTVSLLLYFSLNSATNAWLDKSAVIQLRFARRVAAWTVTGTHKARLTRSQQLMILRRPRLSQNGNADFFDRVVYASFYFFNIKIDKRNVLADKWLTSYLVRRLTEDSLFECVCM